MARRPPSATRTDTLVPLHDALPICYTGYRVEDDGPLKGLRFLLSASLVQAFAQRAGVTQFVAESAITPSALSTAIARHPMHKLGGFFAKHRPFLPGDFVTTDAGTGLVHMAPDHGEDDFRSEEQTSELQSLLR